VSHQEEFLIEIFRNNWRIVEHNEQKKYWYFNISSVIISGTISSLLISGVWKEQYHLVISLSFLSMLIAFICLIFGLMILKINYDITRVIYQIILLSINKYSKHPDLIKYAYVPYGFLKDLFRYKQEARRKGYIPLQVVIELSVPKLSIAALTVSFYFYMLIIAAIISVGALIELLKTPPKELIDLTAWAPVVSLIINIIIIYLYVRKAEEQYILREEARKEILEAIKKDEQNYNNIINELAKVGILKKIVNKKIT